MSTPKDLTLSLRAAADAKASDDSGTYLLYEKNNDLFERVWTGSAVESDTYITSGVKKNTPAAYLIKPDQRLAFYLTESNSLGCYEYDDEDESWVDSGPIEINNVAIPPESKLSACLSPLGLTVFFQDTVGQIKGVSNKDGPWEVFGPLPANAALGTPLTVAVANRRLHLFYVNKDNSVHYLVYDQNTGEWQDNLLEHSKFDEPVVRFVFSENPETHSLEGYCLLENALYSIDSSGKKKMGDVEGDKFIAPANAEAGWRIRVRYSYSYEWWS
jgi:hypothetical protein